jgi:hypothetical protein
MPNLTELANKETKTESSPDIEEYKKQNAALNRKVKRLENVNRDQKELNNELLEKSSKKVVSRTEIDPEVWIEKIKNYDGLVDDYKMLKKPFITVKIDKNGRKTNTDNGNKKFQRRFVMNFMNFYNGEVKK